MANEAKLKSLEKTFKILECFTNKQPELGITEISNRLGLYKSNVHSILTTLEGLGYVEQNKATNKYYLGRNFIRLSRVAISAFTHNGSVHRTLKEISDKLDETVYYGVPEGNHVIYLEGAYPDTARSTNLIQGVTAPLVCTGIGKAILAYSPEAMVNQVLSEPLEKYTEYTLVSQAALREDLVQTRLRGYSVDNMEHEYGVKCVGVPVLNQYNEAIAAISVTGPSLRLEEARIPQIAALLKEKAKSIAGMA